MVLDKLTTVLGEKNARHLLYRTTFNPKEENVQKLSKMTANQAVDWLFNWGYKNVKLRNGKTDRRYVYEVQPLEWHHGKYFIHSQVHPYSSKTHIDITKLGFDRTPKTQLQPWQYNQAIFGNWIREARRSEGIHFKLALFLHSQFTSSLENGYLKKQVVPAYDYLDLCSFFVDKNMTGFAKQVLRSNAMLYFLNIYQNQKGSKEPNENIGREVMELFTVQKYDGKQHWTEADVKQASRVLTGWIDTKFSQAERNKYADSWSNVTLCTNDPKKHYTENKKFSSHFNNSVIKGGNTSSSMEYELNQFVNMLFFKNKSTCIATAQNLFRTFVSPEINRDNEKIITAVSDVLKNNWGNLKKAMIELLTSKAFYDMADSRQGDKYVGAKAKSPLEFSLTLLNHLEINSALPKQGDLRSIKYSAKFYGEYLRNLFADGSMNLFQTDVSGYKPFRNAPYDRIWISQASLSSRYLLINKALYSSLKYGNNKFNVIDFVKKKFKNPKDINELVPQLINHFYSRNWDVYSSTKNQIRNLILGELSEKNWELEWLEIEAKGSKAGNYAGVKSQLLDAIEYILKSPEYQVL